MGEKSRNFKWISIKREILARGGVLSMKRKVFFTLLIVLSLVFQGTTCLADNPIVQNIYTADPAPMVHEGVCYVYTTHDEHSCNKV